MNASPPFTAAQIAAWLRKSPQAIRKLLERAGVACSGSVPVRGIETRTWQFGSLPAELRAQLQAAAATRGYRDVSALPEAPTEIWVPAIPVHDVHQDCLSEAFKLRRVLQPVLESLQDSTLSNREREQNGLAAYAAEFGRTITPRYFWQLVHRTTQRDGAAEQWGRLGIYLPDRLRRKEDAPAPICNAALFPDLALAIQNADPANPDPEKAQRIRKLALEKYDALRAQGHSDRAAGDRIRDYLWAEAAFLADSRAALQKQFRRWLLRRKADPAEWFRDHRKDNSGATGTLTARIEVLGWFIPAAEFFYRLSNRTEDSGSMPEAIRRTISLPAAPPQWPHRLLAALLKAMDVEKVPACPQDIRAEILQRQRDGKPLVPERIAKQIARRSSPAAVRYSRNPTDAILRYANASGGSKFIKVDGEYVPLRVGSQMMPDDGSINFCVCIPWTLPTTPSSRKYGVLVGRFQLLLFVDALSYRIGARSFVVRPRESYRTEDVLHLYNVFMNQHGLPLEIVHEGNVWNAGRVKDCLDKLNVRHRLVYSPHSKQPVENRFNKLWTVMSVLSGGQIGRYRGEMERENALLTSCRGGHTDPRRVFPMFKDAIAIIDQAIAEANRTTVNTDVGQWVPDELWAEQTAETPLRRLDPESAWMFAPCMEERAIRNSMKVTFPLFEGLSAPFEFQAPWMQEYCGARAAVYFDPWGEGRGVGMVQLRQEWNGNKAGTVLGPATQVNDITNYARMMLELGCGPDDSARRIRQQAIAAMRSNRKAVVPGDTGLVVDEERDGLGDLARIERNSGTPAIPRGDDDTARSAERLRRNLGRAGSMQRVEQFERENEELFL